MPLNWRMIGLRVEPRRIAVVVLLAALSLSGTHAWSQTQSRPRPRPVQRRAAVVVVPDLPKPAQSPARLALPALMSTGDGTPRCRSQCSITRYSCLAGGDAQDCDPAWNTCLKTCARP